MDSKEIFLNKILIVDDVLSMRSLTKAILREAGFAHVFDAPDGQEALKLMQKVRVNLIVCDWNMPVMSGLEFFKAVQADPKIAGTPFIMLTSSSEGSKVKEAVTAGITAYMIKPFKPADLVKKISGMLS
ncbi:response regulator [Methyloglobulus morosus KoM1]|jgi:two-component system chemotaxis response regulator CheY|uniref:Response regulator n=1 Tax=Methyloglobulus morosus KoM1 TaxID=1116472 RepID=V5C973_9GAMM|nr:response regulator [Methyloglobulus morosus]ESS73323.1 response regulator [Methyloglobulus morosus KoM1]